MSDQNNMERSRTSPVVEIPSLNRLKRKRTESAESCSPPPNAPQAKKQRSGSATPRPLLPAKPRLPAKTEAERTLAPAIPDVVAGAAQTEAGPSQDGFAPLPTDAPAVKVEIPHQDTHFSPAISTAETMRSAANDAPQNVDMDAGSSTKPDATPEVPALSALQQTIENEFNMQILFKHNELRLIEQELAKCQTALEQLRRSEVKAYPGANGLSEEMSTGLGPAVLPPAGSTHPSHAAPYGVTDGPYTRHYSQWLIPDPAFDVAVESADPTNTASDRAARASVGSARKSTSSKPVAVAEKPSRKSFSSLPNYRAEPSPGKLKLAVVHRQLDGKVVKLVCNNCHRFDFNSVQGFLNHCRIAHKVDYKSHEVAAVDCGSPLDDDELAQWITQAAQQAQNVVTPVPRRSAPKKEKAAAAARAASPSMTVAKESVSKPRAHPLNRSNGNVGPTSATPSRKPSVAQRPAVPVVSSQAATGQGQVPFKPAADTPYLSALFQKNNIGRDLADATEKAKQKVVLGADDDLLSPDTASPVSAAFNNASSNLAAPSTLSRPSSRKGYRQPPTLLSAGAPRHRPSPLAPPNATHQTIPSAPNSAEIPESPGHHHHHHFSRHSHSPTNLSPHTIDSAPGLVSDVDGEEDEEEEEDDARSTFSTEHHPAQATHSGLPPNGRTCAERMELGVEGVDEEMGGMGDDGIVVRRNSVIDGRKGKR